MRSYSYRCSEVKACCEEKLDIRFRKSHELNGWFLLGDKKAARITVPKGRKEVKKGTFRSMAKQLELSVTEFAEVIDCTKSRRDYENLLKERILRKQ